MSASQHRIYFLLQRAAHRLKTEADSALTESGGLTTAQAAMMGIVARDGPVTQRHIADTLSQRESAITAMAKRLLHAGYISKVRSATDARAWSLEATQAGLQAMERMRKPFEQINAKLDASFTQSEMAKLANALKQISECFDREDRDRGSA